MSQLATQFNFNVTTDFGQAEQIIQDQIDKNRGRVRVAADLSGEGVEDVKREIAVEKTMAEDALKEFEKEMGLATPGGRTVDQAAWTGDQALEAAARNLNVVRLGSASVRRAVLHPTTLPAAASPSRRALAAQETRSVVQGIRLPSRPLTPVGSEPTPMRPRRRHPALRPCRSGSPAGPASSPSSTSRAPPACSSSTATSTT